MNIPCVWEHNGNDTLLYAVSHVGAYTRGASLEEALGKMPGEIRTYLRWLGEEPPCEVSAAIVQEKASELTIRDADSDVIFDRERLPLTWEEYQALKALALRSAEDFLTLYRSVPDHHRSCLPVRSTFYGALPRTAEEMYQHTKNVNDYYFREIGVDADHEGSILDCRRRGFAALERQADFLTMPAREGSYGEYWSLRKVLRRFIWHDRIHAKAMQRMAVRTFGPDAVADPFHFGASI